MSDSGKCASKYLVQITKLRQFLKSIMKSTLDVWSNTNIYADYCITSTLLYEALKKKKKKFNNAAGRNI